MSHKNKQHRNHKPEGPKVNQKEAVVKKLQEAGFSTESFTEAELAMVAIVGVQLSQIVEAVDNLEDMLEDYLFGGDESPDVGGNL